MNKQTRTPAQERETAAAISESFIIDSVDAFVDEYDVYQTIRSLRRIKSDWTSSEAKENKDCKESIMSDIHGIETLLIDLAEGNAKRNQLLLSSYEQAQD